MGHGDDGEAQWRREHAGLCYHDWYEYVRSTYSNSGPTSYITITELCRKCGGTRITEERQIKKPTPS